MSEDLFPGAHQSRLLPSANKFHAGSGADGRHYWLTPPDLYRELDAEFHFTFDPCPHPMPEGFDGLTCEWGSSNYVNPPFGSIIHHGRKKGPTAWVRKAIEEHRKGKTVVLVYPVDKWILMLLGALGSDVRNLGDVRWLATEDGAIGPGTGRHIAMFALRASMTPLPAAGPSGGYSRNAAIADQGMGLTDPRCRRGASGSYEAGAGEESGD